MNYAQYQVSYTSTSHSQRQRLSLLWIPPLKAKKAKRFEDVGTSELLQCCGFTQQTASGIFHYLPLGVRVLEKLERLIDKHMRGLRASKVSLSSLSPIELWLRSGRYHKASQLFQTSDAKGSSFILSPTHEEEITSLVAGLVDSYKQLPLRLYQISRKYRDELRPREGLLRSREFLMKDLYTFDVSDSLAMETYREVRRSYDALMRELRIDVVVATAHSGAMGGELSHEYHMLSSIGEDHVLSCSRCGQSTNEELIYKGATDTTSTETHTSGNTKMPMDEAARDAFSRKHGSAIIVPEARARMGVGYEGEACRSADCQGILTSYRCIELAHTFHLGSRYSEALDASVALPPTQQSSCNMPARASMSMGCFGIGLSRLMGAVAHHSRDTQGLNWPRSMAPFEIVIIHTSEALKEAAEQVYDDLARSNYGFDCVLDDRRASFGTKIKDADLIGYPIIIIVGEGWSRSIRTCEVQCRQKQFKKSIDLNFLESTIISILNDS